MNNEKRETINRLKTWGMRWKNYLIGIIIIVLIAVAGNQGWHDWQRRQTVHAEKLYEQFQQRVPLALESPDQAHKAAFMRMAEDMESRFERTPYAQMTALAMAKALYQMADIAGAKAQLQWAMNHAMDDEYRQIARLRLASVLLDEKAYDAALQRLSISPAEAFKGLYAIRRGDVLAAQHKNDAARQVYQNALQWFSNRDPLMHQLVQAKLAYVSIAKIENNAKGKGNANPKQPQRPSAGPSADGGKRKATP